MIQKCVLLFFLFVVNVSGDRLVSNYDDDDDDSDSAFNDIFDDFYDSVFGYNYKESKMSNSEEKQPIFSNGAWICGDCSCIDESKLLYAESLELQSNGDFNGYVETQIGFALNNMRCISIQTDERNTIRRISGSCEGDEVTLGVLAAFNTYIRIYG